MVKHESHSLHRCGFVPVWVFTWFWNGKRGREKKREKEKERRKGEEEMVKDKGQGILNTRPYLHMKQRLKDG